jgi:hypothetical protein
MSTVLRDERLLDLLVKEATEGVTAEESAEIMRLLKNHPEGDRGIVERVAAAVALAGVQEEPLPGALRTKLQRQAEGFVASKGAAAPGDELAARRARPSQPVTRLSRLGWFAAAASLILAVGGWWPRLREAMTPPQIVQVPPTLSELREQLRQAPGALTREWTATGDSSPDVKGDVVWDQATQKGYLRFTGLAANDPTRNQYQLWIFDAKQDERYPIDGGVFDIPAGQNEVVVPIRAKIGVQEPVMFAVTVEKPGGVVVSGREHIVVLAKVAAG